MSATNSFFSPATAYTAADVEKRPAQAPVHPDAVRPDDEVLMLRIQQGEEPALGELLERYGSIVMAIGLKVLRDREEAEELVQDVFFQVFRKCSLYDPAKGAARAWLLQTAYHRAFDRRQYLQLRGLYDRRNAEEMLELVPSPCNVELEAQISQHETLLRRAFENLGQKQKLTLTLFFFEGYTLREISERLKEPLPNVRHHYYRGLKTLKQHLRLNPLKGGPLHHGF